MRRKSKYEADLEHLSRLSSGVKRIAKKLRGRDAKIIHSALETLSELRSITEDLNALYLKFKEIEGDHELETTTFPDQIGWLDLAASTVALRAVREFLQLRGPSRNLQILETALIDLAGGASPAEMFHPEGHPKGRRADAATIMAVKGTMAAMMHVQQSTGLKREQAAAWVVRHISPVLAGRISTKPLTARMVEEWLDRFGGDHAESNAGRERYLLWIGHDPVSPERFREITEHMAKQLPGRKPR